MCAERARNRHRKKTREDGPVTRRRVVARVDARSRNAEKMMAVHVGARARVLVGARARGRHDSAVEALGRGMLDYARAAWRRGACSMRSVTTRTGAVVVRVRARGGSMRWTDGRPVGG